MKYKIKQLKGQATTSILMVMFLGLAVITASVSLIDINMTTTASLVEADSALIVAESGAEEALIRLLRDPNYSGETLNLTNGVASINVGSANPIIVESTGVVGNHMRKVEVSVSFVSGTMIVNSWKEI